MKTMTKKRRRSFFSYMKEHWAGYAMVAPLMIGMLVFCYYPPIYGALLAFTDTKAGETLGNFTWEANFVSLFRDPKFLTSWWSMAKIQIPRLISGVVTPLVFAEIVFSIKGNKAQSLYRVLILLPTVAPGVVTTLLWKEIYQADGLFNTILYHIGIRAPLRNEINWLTTEGYVIPAILIQGFPWIGGSQVLIYVSGLMNIPREVLEAAELDGATEWQKIFKIHIFHISGQIRYFLIFGIINGFQDYGTQVVLTKGKYGTNVPGYYMYELISVGSGNDYGRAAAIGVILFVIIMVLTFICNKFVKFGESKED